MAKRIGRPTSEKGRAQTSKERALAHLRWQQLREKRREWNRVVDAGMAAALAVIRDRLLAVSDRVASLTPEQRRAVRDEIAAALEAWSKADI